MKTTRNQRRKAAKLRKISDSIPGPENSVHIVFKGITGAWCFSFSNPDHKFGLWQAQWKKRPTQVQHG